MTIKIDKLGWPVAALLGGMMAMGALSGFQAGTAPKFATVDMNKVFNDSPLVAANNDALNNARKARFATIEFIDRNSAMDPNDAKKFADLSAKANPTPADKTELDRLHAAGEAATVARSGLMTKPTPTDADKVALADYSNKANSNRALLNTLDAQYTQEMQTMLNDMRDKSLARVREVVRTIAAKQGYTVVFDTQTAPYASNDLTEEASKALKK